MGKRMTSVSFRLRGPATVAVIAAAIAPAGPVQASAHRSVTVCPSGPPRCDYATIHEALDAVANGDRILIAAGSYAGGFTIEKSVSLVGSGADRTTITGGNPVAVTVASESTVVVSGFTITAAFENGVVNEGTLTISHTSVSRNFNEATSHRVDAPGIVNNGTLTVRSSAIEHNGVGRGSQPRAGGVYNRGKLTLVTSSLSGNYGGGNGAMTNEGQATLKDCSISGNDSFGWVGLGNDGLLEIRNCTYESSLALATGGKALIVDTTVRDGGRETVINRGALTIRRSAILDCAGPALINHETGLVNIEQSTLAGCVDGWGDRPGGLENRGTMSVRDTMIDGNVGSATGGGILNTGSITLTRVTAVGNSASDGGGGGGIANYGDALLEFSTLNGNTAAIGGGIANYKDADSDGTVTLVHSEVSGNTAEADYYGTAGIGGGIANYNGTVTLTHSIVTRNTAQGYEGVFGGGIFNSFGTVVLSHSSVFGNIPDDCVGC
jgi:hypothetical protein